MYIYRQPTTSPQSLCELHFWSSTFGTSFPSADLILRWCYWISLSVVMRTVFLAILHFFSLDLCLKFRGYSGKWCPFFPVAFYGGYLMDSGFQVGVLQTFLLVAPFQRHPEELWLFALKGSGHSGQPLNHNTHKGQRQEIQKPSANTSHFSLNDLILSSIQLFVCTKQGVNRYRE